MGAELWPLPPAGSVFSQYLVAPIRQAQQAANRVHKDEGVVAWTTWDQKNRTVQLY